MGRQWNTIIESLGPLSGGTMSINANLTEIEALLTTLQADVADGIIVSSGSSVVTNGTLAQVTSASAVLTAGTLTNGTVNATPTRPTHCQIDHGCPILTFSTRNIALLTRQAHRTRIVIATQHQGGVPCVTP